jgi:serine/threonine-protein kinase RsbT
VTTLEERIVVRSEGDAAEATRAARQIALKAGLNSTRAVEVATAVSEVAANQLRYAGGGEIVMRQSSSGVEIEARDEGPGIPDIEKALEHGWSSVGSLGVGLPGARRLMDEFEVTSAPETGTLIRMAKLARDAA